MLAIGLAEDHGSYGECRSFSLGGVSLPDDSILVLFCPWLRERESARFQAGSGVVQFSGGSIDLAENNDARGMLVGLNNARKLLGEFLL